MQDITKTAKNFSDLAVMSVDQARDVVKAMERSKRHMTQREAELAALEMMVVERLPMWYKGLRIWQVSEGGDVGIYRHPTKKATLGRIARLEVGETVLVHQYNARRG